MSMCQKCKKKKKFEKNLLHFKEYFMSPDPYKNTQGGF